MQSEAFRVETVQTKGRLTMNSREQLPKETVPEEMESMKAPPDMKTGRSLRTCLRGGLTRCVRRIQKRGDARVQCQKEASEYGARSQLTALRMTLRSRRRWSETDISAEHVKEK